MGYLDFWVTSDGLNPQILNTSNKSMKPKTHQKKVCQFIDVINYYHNMWSRRSHTLAPLTNIHSSKVKLKWNRIKQDLFD